MKKTKLEKKGKKAKKSSMSKDDESCAVTTLVRLQKDLENEMYVYPQNTSKLKLVGDVQYVNVPIYEYDMEDNEVGKRVGRYHGTFTYVPGGDCVGTYTFGLDRDDDSGLYQTQIVSPFTCFGAANPITGGTGAFLGASGAIFFCDDLIDEEGNIIGNVLCVTNCADEIVV